MQLSFGNPDVDTVVFWQIRVPPVDTVLCCAVIDINEGVSGIVSVCHNKCSACTLNFAYVVELKMVSTVGEVRSGSILIIGNILKKIGIIQPNATINQWMLLTDMTVKS